MTASIATAIAAKLARTVWSVDAEDLHQEAQLAYYTHVDHCLDHNDPARGTIEQQLGSRIRHQVVNYTWDAGSPVSYKHRRPMLAGVQAVEIDKAHRTLSREDAAGEIERLDLRQRVAQRVHALAGTYAPLALPVLLAEQTPAEVAADQAVPVADVYQAVRQVRDRLREDPKLYRLWREE